jgi:hypothetical protein
MGERADLEKTTTRRALGAYNEGRWRVLYVRTGSRPERTHPNPYVEPSWRAHVRKRDRRPSQSKLLVLLWSRAAISARANDNPDVEVPSCIRAQSKTCEPLCQLIVPHTGGLLGSRRPGILRRTM